MALLLVGGWEILIGIGLMLSRPLIMRIVLSFQVFVLLPQVVFHSGNPLLPTLEGQYAIKNLVLITAGLVIGSTLHRKA
jgi:hypothetical protein